MPHPSEETERRYKMNRFLVISLAFIVVMSVGLGYADELGEVTKKVILDYETDELTDEEEETEGSWVEVELVDEEDESIASESYEIDLPDGSTIGKGSLDEKGEAHSSGLAPGSSEITFPDSDDEAWEKE